MVSLENRMPENYTIAVLGTQFLNPGYDPAGDCKAQHRIPAGSNGVQSCTPRRRRSRTRPSNLIS